jgi:predicted AAA+ superfamily ATPase
MALRPIWLERLESSWKVAPICWLSGVRRVGKTTLCRQLADSTFINCDLPETSELLGGASRFFLGIRTKRLVLDEIHQLDDPSRILKVGADEFPHLQILATGSSTLAATDKFRDSLTGRKRHVHLVPVLASELSTFNGASLGHRMLRGGLPQALLSLEHDRGFYSEWIDSYFARDVQELFRVEKRAAFLSLVEAVLRMSGGLLEATSLTKVASISRPTVLNYLSVMETTQVVTLVRPYSGGQSDRELIQIPKAYGFDTGFVCFTRGIRELRPDDEGLLLEHLVLETLQSISELPRIHYWRDKSKREIDFVLPFDRTRCDAVEVKRTADAFEPHALKAFRKSHPDGRNWLVTTQTSKPHERSVGGLLLTCVSVEDFREVLAQSVLP